MPPHSTNPHHPSQQQQQTQNTQNQQTQNQQNVANRDNTNNNNNNNNGNNNANNSNQIQPQSSQQAHPSHVYAAAQQMSGYSIRPGMHSLYSMQMIPNPIPGNVYVGNLTANVNVHGFMSHHAIPQYMAATGPPGVGYLTGEASHESPQMSIQMSGRGSNRSRGRGRGGINSRGRGGYNGNQHHLQQQQQTPPQQQSQGGQQQPPPQQEMVQPLMETHPGMAASGYTQYYPYSYPFYPAASHMGHPSAQHAAGTPLYVQQMPMYGAHLYGYPHGLVYQHQAMMPAQEYAMVDDKSDEQSQQSQPEEAAIMHPMWQGQMHVEYPEPPEYIQSDDEQAMMNQPPRLHAPMPHVMTPTYIEFKPRTSEDELPSFSMQIPPPQIQTDDYVSVMQQQQSDTEYTLNSSILSPMTTIISSPSSTTSSTQNLTQHSGDLYVGQSMESMQNMLPIDMQQPPPQPSQQEHGMHGQQRQEMIEMINNNYVESYTPMMVHQHHQPPPPMDANYNQLPIVSMPMQQQPPPQQQQQQQQTPPHHHHQQQASPPSPQQQLQHEMENMNINNQVPSPIMTPVSMNDEEHMQHQQQHQHHHHVNDIQQLPPHQQQQHTQQQHQHQQLELQHQQPELQHHYHHHNPQPQQNHNQQPQIFDNINNNNNNNENSVMKNDNNVNLVVSSEQIASNDDHKLVKMTQEKIVINKTNSVKQSAWVSGPPLQHHQSSNKKTTATVSVSAIPNKELIGQPPGIKQQKNVSPVPFTNNKSHLASQKSLPLANEEQQMPPPVVMESKKVEAIPQREAVHNEVTVKPIEFVPVAKEPQQVIQQQAPPVIVPTPTTTTPTAPPPTKSWASLFNQSPAATHMTHTPAPAPVINMNNGNNNHNSSTISANNNNSNVANINKVSEPITVAKKPVAKVSPFESQASNTSSVSTSTTAAIKKPAAEAKSQQAADDFSLKLCGFLTNYKIDNNSVSILPRGLLNRSNYCYINAILQALVACPPFYHLMKSIPKPSPADKANRNAKTPFIDAMIELVSEFSLMPVRARIAREKGKKDDLPDIQSDSPFEPIIIHKILNGIRSDIFQVEGRQEDAEEFLGCILNRLNDEMLELIKLNKPDKDINGEMPPNGEANPDEGDDWKVISGNRNKGTVTRTVDFGRSPISDIFGGKLRYRVNREGEYSTDNIQPFFTLPLDIEKAQSVKDALEILVCKDQLEGMTCSKTKQEIVAWKQVTLEELPVVLVLHLKCFDYKMDGCTKILKALDFPIELKIDSKTMSSKAKYSVKQKQYKLFSVVYHDGKEASKGHYITDVFHVGYGSWIRYDDSTVKAVSEYHVLHPRSPRVPYLLYYRRCDTIGGGSHSSYNTNTHK